MPNFVYQDSPLWPSVTALILFIVIELHQPNRVLWQFGGQQPISVELLNIDRFHGEDARGADHWWPNKHRAYHDCWDTRTD